MLFHKKSIIVIFIMLTASIISFNSCTSETNTSRAEETLEEAGEDFADIFRNEQEELAADLRDLKDDIASQMADLEKSLENTSEDQKTELEKELSELKAYEKSVDQAIYDVEHAVQDGWTKTKSEINELMETINNEFKEV